MNKQQEERLATSFVIVGALAIVIAVDLLFGSGWSALTFGMFCTTIGWLGLHSVKNRKYDD